MGEALVGNEAVDQLTKFNRSLRDFSGKAGDNARGVDGMILTKFDTIDDKVRQCAPELLNALARVWIELICRCWRLQQVGAALSMTYVTGQPILFVGTGQTYSDLRSLRVGHIVGALLQD